MNGEPAHGATGDGIVDESSELDFEEAFDDYDDDFAGFDVDDVENDIGDEYDTDENVEDDIVENPFLDRAAIATDRALALLRHGIIEIVGRMPYSSNATFLVNIDHDGLAAQGIYKPARGERPLWDFPSGLFRREAAAFELSEFLGWNLVPPTIVRDGPLGDGSIQLFVPADFSQHYFTIRDAKQHTEPLMQLCVFDIISNNTDRKGGHVLIDSDQRIWAIDNGLSFHNEFKLRTVIWDFAAETIPRPILDAAMRLIDEGIPASVAAVLDTFERDALLTRTRALLNEQRFPVDHTGRRYPWPLV